MQMFSVVMNIRSLEFALTYTDFLKENNIISKYLYSLINFNIFLQLSLNINFKSYQEMKEIEKLQPLEELTEIVSKYNPNSL